MQKISPNKGTLKKFGMTMAVVFLAIFGLFFFKHKYAGAAYSLLACCVFFVTGLAAPLLLKPVYIIWMRLAFILGWVNTRIILIAIFYLIFTPIGLLMRLFRIDLLERKKQAGSYWKNKEKAEFDPLNYERRF
jgi:multisubunit Na+/H+ antiporter MnhG subunit